MMNCCFRSTRLLVVAPTAVAAALTLSSTHNRRHNISSFSQLEAAPKSPDDPMAHWKHRWDNGKLGWHQEQVYWALSKYGDQYLTSNARVLVPLCGKTQDLPYLASKVPHVVGVEGVAKAVDEFMAENPELDMKKAERKGGFQIYRGNNIAMLCGNFFGLKPSIEGKYDLIWDRAAMVAIDPSMREDYVRVMGSVVKPGGVMLLSGYIRPNQDVTTGPPFTLNEEQVMSLFISQPWVASVEVLEATDDPYATLNWIKRIYNYIRFKGAMKEKIFLIRAK